jgi:hypothetical protein
MKVAVVSCSIHAGRPGSTSGLSTDVERINGRDAIDSTVLRVETLSLGESGVGWEAAGFIPQN